MRALWLASRLGIFFLSPRHRKMDDEDDEEWEEVLANKAALFLELLEEDYNNYYINCALRLRHLPLPSFRHPPLPSFRHPLLPSPPSLLARSSAPLLAPT